MMAFFILPADRVLIYNLNLYFFYQTKLIDIYSDKRSIRLKPPPQLFLN